MQWKEIVVLLYFSVIPEDFIPVEGAGKSGWPTGTSQTKWRASRQSVGTQEDRSLTPVDHTDGAGEKEEFKEVIQVPDKLVGGSFLHAKLQNRFPSLWFHYSTELTKRLQVHFDAVNDFAICEVRVNFIVLHRF